MPGTLRRALRVSGRVYGMRGGEPLMLSSSKHGVGFFSGPLGEHSLLCLRSS